jgi:hypothetical protein
MMRPGVVANAVISVTWEAEVEVSFANPRQKTLSEK